MKQKVIIIGIGFASRLGLIRSVAQTGAEISVIAIGHARKKPLDCYSKYVSHFYLCEGNDETQLLSIINRHCIDYHQKSILIPINDFAAMVLDKNLNSLKEHFLFQHIDNRQGAVTEWMNKEKQKEWASRCGLNVVKSKNINIKSHQYDGIPVGIRYPCFTKTREYTTGYKQTLHRCNNEKELKSVLDNLSARHQDITIMVEEYKEIQTEYALVGVTDGNNVIIPGIIEILLMSEGSVKGVACQGKIMPISGFEDTVRKFKEFVLGTHFIGLFDIDFFLADDILYFDELNLRIGGSGYAVSKMGVNLPAMLVRFFSGEPFDDLTKEISTAVTFANEKMCLDNWTEGYISFKKFRQILHSSYINFLDDKNDPAPKELFEKRIRSLRWKVAMKKYPRIIKRYLKKNILHCF